MMYVMAYFLFTIIIPLETLLFEQGETTYVPKKQRWNRTNTFCNVVWLFICALGTTVVDYIISIRVDQKYRRKRDHTSHHQGRQLHTRVNEAVAMVTQDPRFPRNHLKQVRFDTDSHVIGLDNRCSACISNKLEDFEGPVQKTNRTIKAFAGEKVTNVYTGTIVCSWLDDEGSKHTFHIPKSYYVPSGGCRLPSPQHWARSQSRSSKKGFKYGDVTYHDKSILFWGKSRLTIPLGKNDNVATFMTAPGYNKYQLFCKQCCIEVEDELVKPDVIVEESIQKIDNDDAQVSWLAGNKTQLWSKETGLPVSKRQADKELKEESKHTGQLRMNMKGLNSSNEMKDEVPNEESLKSSELLMYHTMMGHVSFDKLRVMSKQGIIPKYLQFVPTPACAACMYAKATCKPWRNKQRNDYVKREAVCQGEIISVDQMVSPTPGLVAQMIGRPTKDRFKYATVYVDNYSGWSYIHLQKTCTAKETLEGKHAFEEYCRQQGVKVRGYHADNGVFKASEWVSDCRLKHQGLTFAGVNAHHTNGRAERRIRLLQDLARSMMIHADRRWGGGAMIYLLPYAMRQANEAVNNSPNMQDKYKRAPVTIMFNTQVQMNMKHWHPFGCPAYVLEEKLKDDKKYTTNGRVVQYPTRSRTF